jgi:hypothetical protein|tara:strand:+ start:1788 stop:2030 length:243 start_codon:yes stop_codon:yes gene_type:complete
VSNLNQKLLGVALAALLSIIGYISMELATLKANLQEEIGRSEEIDRNQKERITANTIRSLMTTERVTKLEVRDKIFNKGD